MDTTIIARQWMQAFNDHNLDALLALYDENAIHFSPKLKTRHPETAGLIKGKAALNAWWKDALERLPTLHYKLFRLTANEKQVFMEYTRQVTGEADIDVAEILEIANGVIVSSRVYHG